MTGFDYERHSEERGNKDEWLTPPELVKSLGEFDLDPAAPRDPPFEHATLRYFLPMDGLALPWFGRVWCNPPYGTETQKWVRKAAEHGNACVLIFARTETKTWQDYIFSKADSILFVKGRLHFYHVSGERSKMPAVAPSAIVAYGQNNTQALRKSGIAGRIVTL